MCDQASRCDNAAYSLAWDGQRQEGQVCLLAASGAIGDLHKMGRVEVKQCGEALPLHASCPCPCLVCTCPLPHPLDASCSWPGLTPALQTPAMTGQPPPLHGKAQTCPFPCPAMRPASPPARPAVPPQPLPLAPPLHTGLPPRTCTANANDERPNAPYTRLAASPHTLPRPPNKHPTAAFVSHRHPAPPSIQTPCGSPCLAPALQTPVTTGRPPRQHSRARTY